MKLSVTSVEHHFECHRISNQRQPEKFGESQRRPVKPCKGLPRAALAATCLIPLAIRATSSWNPYVPANSRPPTSGHADSRRSPVVGDSLQSN